jgi:hypothetical protein
LCIGALSITAADATETISFCPAMSVGTVGTRGLIAPFTGCDTWTMGTMVSAQSALESPQDELADLDLSVSMPAPVTLTSPIASPLGPWPATGDLNVRWTSAGATSAVVTLTARDSSGSGGASPSIVCLPGTNGQVFVPTALLTQSNLRMREARLTVAAYADRVVNPSSRATAYRLSAGFSTSVILQPNR